MDTHTPAVQEPDIAGSTTPGSLVWWFLLPGVIQGAALYGILEWTDFDQFDIWQLALLWFFAIAPVAHHLVTTEACRRSSMKVAIALAALCAIFMWSMASQFGWGDGFAASSNYPIPQAIFSSLVICVVALPFYRTLMQRRSAWNNYPVLFEFSWNQTVSAAVGGGFILAVFAVLALTIALFHVLGIDLDDILWRREVLMPVAGGAFGLGIGITRTRHAIVHGTRYLLISLLRALLPVHVLITGGFVLLATLQGLDTINSGVSVTFVLLLAVALALTLCSAAVGDGEQPVGRILGWLCRAQSILVFLLCLLAAWALWQRIAQHGLTQERLLASILAAVFFLYGVGYAFTALLPRQARTLQQVNIIMALFTLFVAVLLMTPLLDLPKLAANQQLTRLERGELSAEEVDLGWLRFDAGRAGAAALAQIREIPAGQTVVMLKQLADLDSSEDKWGFQALLSGQEKRADLNRSPSRASLHMVRSTAGDADSDRAADRLYNELTSIHRFHRLCIEQSHDCVVVETDVLKYGNREYLVAIRDSAEQVLIDWFVERDDKSWTLINSGIVWEAFSAVTTASKAEVDALFIQLQAGKPPIEPVTIPALLIGDQPLVPGIQLPQYTFR